MQHTTPWNISSQDIFPDPLSLTPPLLKVAPRAAYFAPKATVPLSAAGDRLCGELICPYPPGIPLLMPGELITREAVHYLRQVVAAGGTITGCKDPTGQTIQILKLD
ncbi:MAG: hypothetical protein AAFN00_22340 [Cyanobacteria bacterium J06558_2]